MALSHPFPELESFEFCHGPFPCVDFIITVNWSFPPRFSLVPPHVCYGSRYGEWYGANYPRYYLGLVELALILEALPPETSYFPNLQRMSCLRHLVLDLPTLLTQDGTEYFDLNLDLPYAGDVVPLSELTHLIFIGRGLYLQELVVAIPAASRC